MARVNKTKIAINLIENAIEDAREELSREIVNTNYALAAVHEGRLFGLRQALNIINACGVEDKNEGKGENKCS